MKTMPFDFIVGNKYTNQVTIRLIESVSVKNNEVRFIEEPDGYKKSGYCTIEQFYEWMDMFK